MRIFSFSFFEENQAATAKCDAYIFLKDNLLLELLRGADLWSVWLARNKLCFQGVVNPRSLGAQIASLAIFWVTSMKNGSKLKLSLILPSDVLNIRVQIDGLMVYGIRMAAWFYIC